MAKKLDIPLEPRRKINESETFNKGTAKISRCLNCGKEISARKKYCDHHCQQEYLHKLWIENWKAGKETGISGAYQISDHIRRFLFEKYNGECCKCHWHEVNPYTGNIPLEVEHIDGDFRNNSEENLLLLCPNCHSLTATYKGANKGYGRQERSKYYDKKEE